MVSPSPPHSTYSSGPILVSIVFGGTFAFVLSAILLPAYKRSLRRLTDRDAPANAFLPESLPLQPKSNEHRDARRSSQSVQSLLDAARARQAGCGAVYAVSGALCAASLTMAFLVAAGTVKPLVFITVFAANLWPVVLSTNVIFGWRPEIKLRHALVYFCVLAALTLFTSSLRHNFHPLQMVVLFVLLNGPATLLSWVFSRRTIRGVGPTVLPFSLVAAGGLWIVFSLVALPLPVARLIGSAGAVLHLGAAGAVILTFSLGLLLMGFLGWQAARLLVRLYRQRIVSDQSLLIGYTWLLFVALQFCVWSMPTRTDAGSGVPWVLSAFPLYLLSENIGLRMLKTRKKSAQPSRLLVLRAFALERKAEQVFERVTMFWRYLGPVSLIGAADLANATVQPDSFLAFVSGRLRKLFISSAPALDARTAALTHDPDPDGRFRIYDFFCYRDTWKPTVSCLMQISHVVLADFRGLGEPEKLAGCEWEIAQLANSIGLERCVFLLDDPEDESRLHSILALQKTPEALHTPRALTTLHEVNSTPQSLEAILSKLLSATLGKAIPPAACSGCQPIAVPEYHQ